MRNAVRGLQTLMSTAGSELSEYAGGEEEARNLATQWWPAKWAMSFHGGHEAGQPPPSSPSSQAVPWSSRAGAQAWDPASNGKCPCHARWLDDSAVRRVPALTSLPRAFPGLDQSETAPSGSPMGPTSTPSDRDHHQPKAGWSCPHGYSTIVLGRSAPPTTPITTTTKTTMSKSAGNAVASPCESHSSPNTRPACDLG
ncbi:uncharacterized protein B0I36DRAFT_391348 [Microdochium trichocladiopsis]|uniref:Uncharacterized protein n=1 Tax=Microdochium trichocladiopsis TaxID=1682393 RepID=A0A9P9BZV7_9PEZI|nr:uncharacterized protein B0I36DRAFT_391348 [Microdochium trichocladiopsis]KAH7040514.1 hypothetical protein B0I36DRAFT_391348 [Microdochium trichocladiopsis]